MESTSRSSMTLESSALATTTTTTTTTMHTDRQKSYQKLQQVKLDLMHKLEEKFINILDDKTLEFQARGLAWYVLFVKHIPYEVFCEKLESNPIRVRGYLEKLLACQSEFATIVPLSIGIDHISNLASGKMQKSLDVKHLKSADGIKQAYKQDLIIPEIKPNILFSHNHFVWIRFFVATANDAEFINDIKSAYPKTKFSYCQINDNVFELYVKKTESDVSRLEQIVDCVLLYLDKKKHDIVFCSELILFKHNTQLFISNFIKFMFCYTQSKDVFELDTSDDYIAFNHYMLNCCLFLHTKNLANMSDKTHSPLNNYTAERPSVLLNKSKESEVHIVEGNRPLLSTDKHSDLGTSSTRIELVHSVDLKSKIIDDII